MPIVTPQRMDPDERRERERVYAAVLGDARDVLHDAGIRFVVFGSIASSVLARPYWEPDEDIDFFVRPTEAGSALEALGAAGFETSEHDPLWIYKATRDGVTVDLIFRAAADVYVDDEMLDRATTAGFLGVEVDLIPAEDLVVMKAVLHDEERSQDWFDALAIVSGRDLDWEYLLRRAEPRARRRVAALLLYARSNDAAVPDAPLRSLLEPDDGA